MREEPKHRLNRQIRAYEVRLNGVENEPLGIVSLQDALRRAEDMDLDLVEIAPTATPPVCRIMDYGKFKYQEQKRASEAKAKQTVVEVKEVKFRPGTDVGDYNVKMRNIRRFLMDGDKCKISLRYKGREITHQELGMALMNRIREDLGEHALIESSPRLEGRQMIMMIGKGKKKFPEEVEAERAAAAAAKEAQAAQGAQSAAAGAPSEGDGEPIGSAEKAAG